MTATTVETSRIFMHDDGRPCVMRYFGLKCLRDHYERDVSYQPALYHWNLGYVTEIASGPTLDEHGDMLFINAMFYDSFRPQKVWLQDLELQPPATPCPGCGRMVNGYTIDGTRWCGACVAYCECHHDLHPRNDLYYAGDNWWCEDFGPTCSECGCEVDGDECFHDEDEYRCDDCRPCCEGCGESFSYLGEECETCADANGIRPYGQTDPQMWLGGPVDRDDDGKRDGYYLGIELEVSADLYCHKVAPIRDWAEGHLTSRDALDLKHDSSVEGFEIVTQPMTPEFFENVDWTSFFTMLNETLPLPYYIDDEPEAHGMHVHIGRAAFDYSDVATAAFAYLLGADDQHLVRISRREPTHYCTKTSKPVSEAITGGRSRNTEQGQKLRRMGIYPTRGAINLSNALTIEIRSAKSTRDPQEFIDSVRVVYVAAEYIRHLTSKGTGFIPPKALHWSEFARWTATAYPVAFASIAGIPAGK